MKPSITPISAGQKEQFVRVITVATKKATGVAIDELAKSGVINSENLQRVLSRGDELVADVTTLIKEKLAKYAENIPGCLKLISGAETITLEPTDGKETMAKAGDLFRGFLDSDFENYGCNVKSKPTEKQNVAVREMIKDGDFRKIFGGLSDDLDSLCLSQAQIIQFVKNHRKWLRTDGYATLFLFKVDKDFFVARVNVNSDGNLEASVIRCSDVSAWIAERRYRVVTPQLSLGV